MDGNASLVAAGSSFFKDAQNESLVMLSNFLLDGQYSLYKNVTQNDYQFMKSSSGAWETTAYACMQQDHNDIVLFANTSRPDGCDTSAGDKFWFSTVTFGMMSRDVITLFNANGDAVLLKVADMNSGKANVTVFTKEKYIVFLTPQPDSSGCKWTVIVIIVIVLCVILIVFLFYLLYGTKMFSDTNEELASLKSASPKSKSASLTPKQAVKTNPTGSGVKSGNVKSTVKSDNVKSTVKSGNVKSTVKSSVKFSAKSNFKSAKSSAKSVAKSSVKSKAA